MNIIGSRERYSALSTMGGASDTRSKEFKKKGSDRG
jgi:hypothetical protein